MRGSRQGELRMHVLNMAAYDNIPAWTDFHNPHVTTVSGLSKELLSADHFFQYGKYNILLRQPNYEDGVSELYRPAKPGVPEARVPLVYDWVSRSWKLYYVPSRMISQDHMDLLARHIDDVTRDRGHGAAEVLRKNLYSVSACNCLA